MEVTRFIIYCVIGVLSVGGTIVGCWQAYSKKVNEKIRATELKSQQKIEDLKKEMKEKINALEKDVHDLQKTVNHGIIERLANIEGEMKSMRNVLGSINTYFIQNTPKG